MPWASLPTLSCGLNDGMVLLTGMTSGTRCASFLGRDDIAVYAVGRKTVALKNEETLVLLS